MKVFPQCFANYEQALDWAVKDCESDIVSMSFGWQEGISEKDTLEISKTIGNLTSLRDYKVLFFAAASNSGGNGKLVFPARHEHVIPIRATDADGEWAGFNPARHPEEAYTFTTLGVDVPGFRKGERNIPISGTSVATAIAAGMAALILFDAQIQQRKQELWGLWTRSGMSSMFRTVSTKMGRTEYYLPRSFTTEEKEIRLYRMNLAVEGLIPSGA